jgi:hypothetical protein
MATASNNGQEWYALTAFSFGKIKPETVMPLARIVEQKLPPENQSICVSQEKSIIAVRYSIYCALYQQAFQRAHQNANEVIGLNLARMNLLDVTVLSPSEFAVLNQNDELNRRRQQAMDRHPTSLTNYPPNQDATILPFPTRVEIWQPNDDDPPFAG